MQRIGGLKTTVDFRKCLEQLNLELPCDDAPLSSGEGSPLASAIDIGGFQVGNRWCVHPMEGWDGTPDGHPSEHTIRRWQHFGQSGCKLIWGCEAVAVRPEGRANPNQLTHRLETVEQFALLREHLVSAHEQEYGAGAADDLFVGLQLTHSGRFCRPNRKDLLEPRIAYHHPVLDRRFGIDPGDDSALLTDDDLQHLRDDYIAAAKTAEKSGYQFVDVKACHGYLLHEFLSAHTRPGKYGGDLQGRSLLLREIIEGIRAECPKLQIGVRLSLFDFCAFSPNPEETVGRKLGRGIPEEGWNGPAPFGCSDKSPTQIDLSEPVALLDLLNKECGVTLFNLSAGSPYYNPHIQRPAFYPPSDGYSPPEDPLVGCVRQIQAVREIKQQLPHLVVVGTAYSYLQEYLPHVAQAVVREGWTDFVGLGRLILSDWTFGAKVLRGEDYRADKKICRTFSDCTTAPRNGLISGCYPLDPHYKELPEFEALKAIKQGKDS
ncbi:MAG: NADH:flavin oxidoreductase [Planctomycetaceae bacterium]|nr:NADH:flavin oxidoreductase [Planctomycetaceae bacterium]MCA9044778.1 NADH:flavin oxidoreductase [Planctomycetaceae bacterium]